MESIEGRIIGAKPGQRIVLYAKAGALWWIQPMAVDPFTTIQQDSSWKNSTHLGTEYAALLVKPGYKAPDTVPVLPDADGSVIASAVVQGKGYVPTLPKTVHFSGYEWDVRQVPSDRGGKTNPYDPSNVWTDKDGFLHLRIAEKAGKWTCAEISLKRSLGPGLYAFTVRDSSPLEAAAVLTMHTFDEIAVEENHRDVGIEVSRWGEPDGKNAQFVIQPYFEPTNVVRFTAPAGKLTYAFRWETGRVAFRTLRGETVSDAAPAVAQHIFTTGVPSPGGEVVYVDLYAFGNSRIPLRNGVEIVVEKFQYLP